MRLTSALKAVLALLREPACVQILK